MEINTQMPTVQPAPATQLPIDKPQINNALTILDKYRQGKQTIDDRIIEDEKLYRERYWEPMQKESKEVDPFSAWLFNSLENKHADSMDNIPCANILAREQGDEATAKLLTSVVPCILKNTEFETVYSEEQRYKLKSGTGLYGVFWDADRLHGLGDIAITKCDILNLYWKAGISDIQDSPNLFYITLEDNEALKSEWPQLVDVALGSYDPLVNQYAYDSSIDTEGMTAVVDWYYKRKVNGRTVVHLAKFAAGTVLYASENNPKTADTGYYSHGYYPFVMDPLFKVEKSPCGLGYVDIGKYTQQFIDAADKAILKNMLANSKPRFFIQSNADFNEDDLADTEKEFIKVEGGVGDDRIRPIEGKQLPGIYMNVYQQKIDELKEVTGNRDVSTGGTTSGVTAASAIAAMQEAGSKLSRDSNKGSYRAFEKVIYMVVELVRQFYTLPRCFRIMGDNQSRQYIMFSNAAMQPRELGMIEGIDTGTWTPMFDLEIQASKQSAYSRMAQNELALQFYQMGFFNPQQAVMALTCLEMMDFNGKETITQKISDNAGGFQMALQQMALQVIMQQEAAAQQPTGGKPAKPTGGESSVTSNARARSAQAASPT